MGFGFTSPVSGLAPIQIGWSGTSVPLRGTTLAGGNDPKSHRDSAGFQRQQRGNQTGSRGSAKAAAPAGRARTPGLLSPRRRGGCRAHEQAPGGARAAQDNDEVENVTRKEEKAFSLLGAILQKAEESCLRNILGTKKKAIIFIGS